MRSLTTNERARPGPDFFAPVDFMRREIERLFDQAGANGWSSALDRNFAALRMDVAETEKDLLVTAEIPGIDIKDIDVSLASGVLTIKGEKRSERDEQKANYHLVERSFGAFERRIAVPEGCDPNNVKAEYSNGILKVVVPKPADAAATAKIKITKT